jgi:hypothetical protein
MSDAPETKSDAAAATPKKPLSDAAKRALAEAEARRKARKAEEAERQAELGGPKGPEPTRYGDWEKKGITYDF